MQPDLCSDILLRIMNLYIESMLENRKHHMKTVCATIRSFLCADTRTECRNALLRYYFVRNSAWHRYTLDVDKYFCWIRAKAGDDLEFLSAWSVICKYRFRFHSSERVGVLFNNGKCSTLRGFIHNSPYYGLRLLPVNAPTWKLWQCGTICPVFVLSDSN